MREKKYLFLFFFTKKRRIETWTLKILLLLKIRMLEVGTIMTMGVRYGLSRTGKPIFLCRPLVPSLHQEVCKIVYGGTLKGRVVIVYKRSESSVEIVHVIGLASRSILNETLMYLYGIQRPRSKIVDTTEQEKSIRRRDLTHLPVFSIDPKGCRDIDDAFSIEYRDEEENPVIVVGVHIAQPILFLTADTIQERVHQAFSTLYCLDGNMKSLWGREVEEASSLLQGETRAAYSFFFTVQNGHIESIETCPSFVCNTLATHYDDLDAPLVQELLEITHSMKDVEDTIDTHETVAYWMVRANHHIGSSFPNIPLRVQSSSTITSVSTSIPSSIDRVFQQFSMEKASYVLEKGKDLHVSLGLHGYTHFTSPIRRMMDTMIHHQITYGTIWPWTSLLERINELDRASSRFHRTCRLVEAIDRVFSSSTHAVMTGYLYEKIERGYWRIYVPDLESFLKVHVVAREMLPLHPLGESSIDHIQIGDAITLDVHQKPAGFMPMEQLLVTARFLSFDS